MAAITTGAFKFTKRVKDPSRDPNEYNAPYKEATAELSYAGAEGDNPSDVLNLADLVRDKVMQHVAVMLGGIYKVSSQPTITKAEHAAASAAIGVTHQPTIDQAYEEVSGSIAATEAVQKALDVKPDNVVRLPGFGAPQDADPAAMPPKRTRRTKAEMEAARAAEGTSSATPLDTGSSTVDIHAPAAVEMTTEEFLHKITEKNGERLARVPNPDETGYDINRDPREIQKLVATYVTPPQKSRDIPAAMRAKFLAELAKL